MNNFLPDEVYNSYLDARNGPFLQGSTAVVPEGLADELAAQDTILAQQQKVTKGIPNKPNSWKAQPFTGTKQDLEQGYKVKKGDTLWSISKATGIPINVLTTHNNITDPTKVRAGSTISIPSTEVVNQYVKKLWDGNMQVAPNKATYNSMSDYANPSTGYSHPEFKVDEEAIKNQAMMGLAAGVLPIAVVAGASVAPAIIPAAKAAMRTRRLNKVDATLQRLSRNASQQAPTKDIPVIKPLLPKQQAIQREVDSGLLDSSIIRPNPSRNPWDTFANRFNGTLDRMYTDSGLQQIVSRLTP